MLDLISNDSAPATLPIAQIRRDGGTQPRQGMDEDAVNDYANTLRAGDRLPAVDVMFDGTVYWLFDGFHRTEAHLRAGLADITVTIHRGSLEDAQWRSFGANKGHGLRRTNADKERAVRAALRHANGAGLSNVQLAKHVGVDDKTVARYRSEMETTSEIPRLNTRTGADGKARKAPPTETSAQKAARYAAEAAASREASRRALNPCAPTPVATFQADPTDPSSASAHLMEFAHIQPASPSLTPAVASSPSLPADLVRSGWELRQIGGVGKWWCHNRSGSKATATHERAEDAIAEARGMAGERGAVAQAPIPAPEHISLTVRLLGNDDERRAMYAWLAGLDAVTLAGLVQELYLTSVGEV